MGEAQHVGLVARQAQQQVVGLGLLARHGRVLVVAQADDGLIAVGQVGQRVGAQAVGAGPTRLGDEILGVQQQSAHRHRPAVAALGGALKLPQVMDVAQSVIGAFVFAVGRPAVVHGDTRETVKIRSGGLLGSDLP